MLNPTVNDGLASTDGSRGDVEPPVPGSGDEEPADGDAPKDPTPVEDSTQAREPASADRFACSAPVRHEATAVVASDAELSGALADAEPGDVIELRAGGTFGALSRLSGLRGTSSSPIVITTDPSNPATIDGGRSDANGISIADSEWVEIRNVRIRNVVYAGLAIGDGHGAGGRPVRNLLVHGVEISNTGQNALHVNDNSSNIDISCNEIYATGWYRPQYGEGIYLGMGSTVDDDSHDIRVRGNHIHDITSEAVDVKARVYNVDITDNHIHDVDVPSQGAITVGLNEVWYRSGNYRIERNVIHDVTSRQYDGAAIWVGHGDTFVANNVMWNLPDDEAITTSADFANQDARTVRIYHNTIWNAPDGPLAMNSGNSGGGAISRASHDVRNNLAPDTSMGAGNFVARGTDLVAPTGATMDAGDGPGSGLALKPGSPIANRAEVLSTVVTDLAQHPRGATPDPGAFETP